MPSVLVSVAVGVAVAVAVLVGVGLEIIVGVNVTVDVSIVADVIVPVLTIVSVKVVVNLPLQVTGLMPLGSPLAGTGNVKPVRNTLPVGVSGTVVSQRLVPVSKLVVVMVMVGEKLIDAPGTFTL